MRRKELFLRGLFLTGVIVGSLVGLMGMSILPWLR
jgi:hypothetical protein